MKAAAIFKYGDAEEFRIIEKDSISNINDGDVLIGNHSTSVNPIDFKIRKGMFKVFTGKKFPKILGVDFAGTVRESKSNKFKKGDEVFGMLDPMTGGSYCDEIIVNEKFIVKKPENLDFKASGVLPAVGLTALLGLHANGRSKKGMQILINGCTGGVGSTAVQIAKAYGGEVTGVCSTRNMEFASGLGVDHLINYEGENLYRSKKYDLIFDTIGNLNPFMALKILNKDGICTSTGFSLKLIIASLLFKKFRLIKVKPDTDHLKLLKEMAEAGNINPIIEKSYPLDNIRDAHVYAEKGKTRGKISIGLQ